MRPEIAELPLTAASTRIGRADRGRRSHPSELGESYGQREGAFDHQRPAQLFNNYCAGRVGQQLLWHLEPGISNPGGAVVAGRRAGVFSCDQQHGAEYALGRRHRELVPLRHQRVARRVWSSAQHESGRHGFFKPDFGGNRRCTKTSSGERWAAVEKDKLFSSSTRGFSPSQFLHRLSDLPTAAERGLTSSGGQLGYT